MAPEVAPDLVAEYATRAGADDEAGAQAIVDETLAGGLSPTMLFRDLLAPAQVLVGTRWETREWTVRQEHTATAVTARIIDRLGERVSASAPARGTVLVAVAEGEWHRISVEMVGYALRIDGWDVVPIPPGTRAGQLASSIHEAGPVAVVVSCALPALLPGARRLVVTAQDAGTPCVVGGRAFGSTGRRADGIGADGWAPDVVAAAGTLAAHAGFAWPSERLEHEAVGDYAVVRSELGRLTATLGEGLAAAEGDLGNGPLDLALWLTRSLLAALLCADGSILDEDAAWVARRAGTESAAALLEALHDALPRAASTARGLVAGVAV